MMRAATNALLGLFLAMQGVTQAADIPPEGGTMHIEVRNDTTTVRFRLNDTPAARALYAQLPLRVEVKNYSNDEKIFYPPEKLETARTPLANAKTGTLAYYAPWGNVVMFYADFGKADGLYALGQAVSGMERISEISGIVQIE